jgi:hypothetical protein
MFIVGTRSADASHISSGECSWSRVSRARMQRKDRRADVKGGYEAGRCKQAAETGKESGSAIPVSPVVSGQPPTNPKNRCACRKMREPQYDKHERARIRAENISDAEESSADNAVSRIKNRKSERPD